MKALYLVLLVIAYATPASAWDFRFRIGFGEEKKVDASPVCPQTIAKADASPARSQAVSKPQQHKSDKSKPKTAVAETSSKEVVKNTPKEKPEYLKKTEKMVKVKKPHKRDWFTLGVDSIGAAGITYGARKSNWFIGSGGAAVLLYSLISERNTNSFLDQTVAIGSGIGLGYLPKIKEEDPSNQDNKVTLPPPPAP